MTNKKLGLLLLPLVSLSAIGLVEVVRVISAPTTESVVCDVTPAPMPHPKPQPKPQPTPAPAPQPAPVA